MAQSGDELKKAKAYQKQKQTLALLHLVFTPAILFLAILTPASELWKDWASALATEGYTQAALYVLFFLLYLTLMDLPWAFYAGFILEHRFGLSNQTFGDWLKDFLKKSLLSVVLSLALIVALYALIWNFSAWWLLAWAGYVLVSFVLGKIFPVWIVPLFYRYGKVEDESLKKRIFELTSRFGMPIENVYSLNLSKTTKKANAAFMGIGRTKRVVLSDTLIENFNGDEIETVVAHELGHFKHHDIWKQLSFGIVTSFLAFWIAFHMLGPAADAFGFEGVRDIAALPLVFLIFYVFGFFLMPIQNGFSRLLERWADRFALKAFPHPTAFVSSMEKLARVNLADPHPNPVMEWFFYDHPSIGKRIRMAKEEHGK